MKRLPLQFCCLLIVVVSLIGSRLAAQPATAPTSAPSTQPTSGVIRVKVLMDGRSRLLIRDNTIWWFHLNYAAPGRHNGRDEPTLINGKEWLPDWPEAIGENRNTRINSEPYDGLTPPLPAAEVTAEVKPILARGSVKVVQQPAKDNRYTLSIEFDDNKFDGSEDYEVEIHYAPAK